MMAIVIIIGINNLQFVLLCCFASYSATMMEGWNNVGPTPLLLSVFFPYNLHFPSCKHSNRGEGVCCCRGCDCQIPTEKGLKVTEPECISESIRKHC